MPFKIDERIKPDMDPRWRFLDGQAEVEVTWVRGGHELTRSVRSSDGQTWSSPVPLSGWLLAVPNIDFARSRVTHYVEVERALWIESTVICNGCNVRVRPPLVKCRDCAVLVGAAR